MGRTNSCVNGSNIVAFVQVVYPVGQTVTCSNGLITLSSDTSGSYIFAIVTEGVWTLAMGGNIKTVTVVYGNRYTVTFKDTELPYSNSSSILSELWRGKFSLAENIGDDFYAYNYSALQLANNGDLLTATNTYLYYQRRTVGVPVTVYLTSKSLRTDIISRLAIGYYIESSGGTPGFFQNNNGNIYTSKYGGADDHNTGVSAGNLFTIAFNVDSSGDSAFYVNGNYFETKTGVTLLFPYIYFSGSGKDRLTTTQYGAELQICHIAVVDGAESGETITANQNYLLSEFALS